MAETISTYRDVNLSVSPEDAKGLTYWVFAWCQEEDKAPEWYRLGAATKLYGAQEMAKRYETGPDMPFGKVLATKVEYHAEGWSD